ncbi:hypothetical protein ACSFBX_10085 [Variovorax sp. RB2P76]|uniref:hypothetical protein n=1 Tax=Variovorax sp. RB2P76 TaxID=3443736 RepID=UPI003F488E4B
MRLIYNDDDLMDAVTVLQYVDSYTAGIGVKNVIIDSGVVFSVVSGCKLDFPHIDGIEKASTFKKVANFICFFISQRPLRDPFPASVVGERLAKVDNHQNAIIAFALAMDALERSVVHKKQPSGEIEPFQITSRIEVSPHSYRDIVEALATATPATHFKLVTVLLEQLVYKTNPNCQYVHVQQG